MIKDKLLAIRTTALLTQSESGGPVKIYGGTNNIGMAANVIVPDAYGANDTVLPRVWASSDGSTYNLISVYQQGAIKTKGGKEFFVPFELPNAPTSVWYLKVELLVTIASTTAGFGTALVYIGWDAVDWSRVQNFG